ncbi:hypothetical protein AcW1_003586 [Taiwanofungus camphoratus]|nr:hypothetical protein AcV5_001954 [Antrodia cinnamomea]KAI0941791.1 hypothetical protein AcW1_003586 [Antrodia cinnamomea]KAI0960712.1 hypothetical protein AcV7_000016 [Antrodia cinnamomea]
MSDVYTFSTVDGGKTFTRSLYGLEAVCCSYAEGGIFFYTGLCSVRLPSAATPERLQSAFRLSWIRLRHLAPSIALKISQNSDKAWIYQYDVPSSLADVEKWAHETLYIYDDEKSIVDRHLSMLERTWLPSAGRYSLELHAGPDSKKDGKWVFGIYGPHANADGRITMELLNQMLIFLREELLSSEASAVSALVWGKETIRLPPSANVLTGRFDKFLESQAASGKAGPPAPPPGFIPFLPPAIRDPTAKGVIRTRLVVLDVDQTTKVRAIAKSHGRTVTQLVDSVFAVSHVEAALTNAKARGEERFNTVADLYEIATNWLIPLAFKDQRPSLAGYTSLLSPKGTTLFAVDGYGIFLDMSKIRKALCFNKAEVKFNRDVSDAVFWDGVVSNYVDLFNQQKFDHMAYLARASGFHDTLPTFTPQQLSVPAFASSSIGHVEGLGLFKDFRPSSGSEMAVHELLHSVSGNTPVVMAMYWQFDGKIAIYFQSGASFNTEDEMDTLVKCFRGWMDSLTA